MMLARSKYLIVPFRTGSLVSSTRMSSETRKMSSETETLNVLHDEDHMEFYIKLGNEKAYLQYELEKPGAGMVDMQHTVVPEAFRGRGIAKILAKVAFDHFVGQKRQMKLTCWYLQKYYQDNSPQYQDNVLQ